MTTNNYQLASHDSWTFLQPTKWWMQLINPLFAQCQKHTIKQQYNNGARLFDLRIRFNKNNIATLAHGIIDYRQLCPEQLWNDLTVLNSTNDCTIRLILELHKKRADEQLQIKLFKAFADYYQCAFSNITFTGGRMRYNWQQLIPELPDLEDNIDNKYSSVDGKWWNKLLPKLYAKLNNKHNLANGTNKQWLMIDYV